VHRIEYYCLSEIIPFLRRNGWSKSQVEDLRQHLIGRANGHDMAWVCLSDPDIEPEELEDEQNEWIGLLIRAEFPNEFNVDITL
jgi:hypothetical protein